MTEEIKFLNNEEINFLQNLLKNPYKPFVTISSENYDFLCSYSNGALNANKLLNTSDEDLQNLEDKIISSIKENEIIYQHNRSIQSQIEKIVLKIFKNYGVLPKKKN